MVCLNGSATVRIEFQNLNIYNNSIVSQRPKNVKIIPRPSQYILPEIGIGKSALKSTIAIVTDSKNPRSMIVSKAILDLQARLTKIEEQVSTKTQLEILIPLRDDFNRDAIRLLALALGSKAMGAGSLVARLQLEMILLDSIIQPPSAIESKILNAGRG